MDDKRVLTDEDIVRKLICNPACAPDSAVRAVLATLADYPERRRIIEDARRIERLVLERVGMGGGSEPSLGERPNDNSRHPSEPAAEPTPNMTKPCICGNPAPEDDCPRHAPRSTPDRCPTCYGTSAGPHDTVNACDDAFHAAPRKEE